MIWTLRTARLQVLIIAATWSLAASGWAAEPPFPLAGSYAYVGGDPEMEALFASVERVVQKMNLFVRGIARRRLRKPNLPSAKIILTITPTTITVARTGRTSVITPRTGKPAKWLSPHGAFMVKHVLSGASLLETIDGRSSHSTNRFTLGPDGVTLRVQTRIASSRLPGPVVFVLTYRRQ